MSCGECSPSPQRTDIVNNALTAGAAHKVRLPDELGGSCGAEAVRL